MRTNWSVKFCGLVTVLSVAVFATGSLEAQHHHHDAAGHRVDHFGHHIDNRGHHTGVVGVYDNSYYRYPQNYVYQQPVQSQGYGNNGYYSTPTVMQNYVPTAVTQNVVPSNVVPYAIQTSPTGTVVNGGTISILNPADSGGDVKYALNGTAYSIKPGYSQSIQNDRTWTVEFGSGGSAGNVRYSLQTGTYKFKVTEAGWNLFKSQEQARVAEIPPAPAPDELGPVPESVANERRSVRVPINASQP